jgi:hypothetical protein
VEGPAISVDPDIAVLSALESKCEDKKGAVSCAFLTEHYVLMPVYAATIVAELFKILPRTPNCFVVSYSSSPIATGCGLVDRGVGSSSPGRFKNSGFSVTSIPAPRG